MKLLAINHFLENNKLKGIDRVVPVGQALEVDFNWDGYDINKVYILAGYKGEMIKKKYHDTKINLVDLECIVEKKPLGTAGSLSQLKNKITNDFIVLMQHK